MLSLILVKLEVGLAAEEVRFSGTSESVSLEVASQVAALSAGDVFSSARTWVIVELWCFSTVLGKSVGPEGSLRIAGELVEFLCCASGDTFTAKVEASSVESVDSGTRATNFFRSAPKNSSY